MSVYQSLSDILEGGRNKDKRTIPSIRSTQVIRRSADMIALRYHETDVILAREDGRVILDSGGWRTLTTKERMCAFGPCNVSQVRGVWYLKFWEREYVFADGIMLNERTGNVTGAGVQDDDLKFRKAVKGYVKQYVGAMQSGELGKAPGSGDCLFCLCGMQGGDVQDSDGAHLRSHIEESYLVPSLGVCVLRDQHPVGVLSKHAAYALQETLRTGEPMKAAPCESQVRRAFMKYFSSRLGLVA